MMRVRRIAIVIIAVLVAGCGERRDLGGGWQMRLQPSWIDSGAPQWSLYRNGVEVDELVFLPKYYAAADCLIYGTSRNGLLYFAACDDRVPLRLKVAEEQRWTWSITDSGLVKWGRFRSNNGVAERELWAFPVADLQTRSKSLPQRHIDWPRRDGPFMEPLLQWRTIRADERNPQSGNSMLTDAIVSDNVDAALALIRPGVDLNAANHPDMRPLIAAAEKDQVEVVQRLLETGANPYVRNSRGDDLVMIAVNIGDARLLDVVTHSVDMKRMNVAAAEDAARKRNANDLLQRLTGL